MVFRWGTFSGAKQGGIGGSSNCLLVPVCRFAWREKLVSNKKVASRVASDYWPVLAGSLSEIYRLRDWFVLIKFDFDSGPPPPPGSSAAFVGNPNNRSRGVGFWGKQADCSCCFPPAHLGCRSRPGPTSRKMAMLPITGAPRFKLVLTATQRKQYLHSRCQSIK